MEDQQLIRISTNLGLNSALLNLEDQLTAAAERNALAVGEGFTQAEKRAIVQVEKLKLVGSLDLAALMLRGKIIADIENNAIWADHPNGYQSMREMAEDIGVSISELSDTKRLCEVVFPYMIERLGIHPAQMWEEIGKSKFRELSSILSVVIDGTELESDKGVNMVARNILENAAASALVEENDWTDEQVREGVVRDLLETGRLPVTEMRRRIRPNHTENIEASLIRSRQRNYFIAEMTEDQFQLITRLLNSHLDTVQVELPEDSRQRVNEAARIPVIRDIAGLTVLD
jgi:hypothetical protein